MAAAIVATAPVAAYLRIKVGARVYCRCTSMYVDVRRCTLNNVRLARKKRARARGSRRQTIVETFSHATNIRDGAQVIVRQLWYMPRYLLQFPPAPPATPSPTPYTLRDPRSLYPGLEKRAAGTSEPSETLSLLIYFKGTLCAGAPNATATLLSKVDEHEYKREREGARERERE
jgi:hypothetical protein